MISKILQVVFGSKNDMVNKYLSSSSDIFDLEERQRKLARKGIY